MKLGRGCAMSGAHATSIAHVRRDRAWTGPRRYRAAARSVPARGPRIATRPRARDLAAPDARG